MKNKKTMIYILSSALIVLCICASQGSAQPSDAQIKKDVMGPKTASLLLGGPGKIEFSSTYKKWVWNRNFTAKVKTDDPGVFVTVTGYASYDVMGGRYVFWRTFSSGNSYSGIPNLSASDVQAVIKKFGVKEVMGNYAYSQMVGDVESMGLSKDPKFEWHTPISVSFNVVAVYAQKGSRGEETFRVRLYRDDPKAEWKRIGSTWNRSRQR